MPRIVINADFGGYGLSKEAVALYNKLKGDDTVYSEWDIQQSDPLLVQVVETLGDKANGVHAH